MSSLLTFVAERESSRYVTVFDGESLYCLEDVSGKVARNATEALETGQSPHEALGDKAMVVPAADITRIRTAEHDDFVQVRFTKAGAEKHHVVAMPGLDEQLALVRSVGATIPGAEEVSGPIPVAQALIGPGFATIAVVGITTVFFMLARDVAAGEEIDTSGRRGGLKLLIARILDVTGTGGVIAVGALALAGALFWGYKRAQSPPVLTTFEIPD